MGQLNYTKPRRSSPKSAEVKITLESPFVVIRFPSGEYTKVRVRRKDTTESVILRSIGGSTLSDAHLARLRGELEELARGFIKGLSLREGWSVVAHLLDGSEVRLLSFSHIEVLTVESIQRKIQSLHLHYEPSAIQSFVEAAWLTSMAWGDLNTPR